MTHSPDSPANPFHQVKARHILPGFLLAQMLGAIAVTALSYGIGPETGLEPTDPIWFSFSMYVGTGLFLVWLVPYLRRRRVSSAQLMGSVRLSPLEVRNAALVAIGCLIFSVGAAMVVFGLLSAVSPQLSEELLMGSFVMESSSLPVLQRILNTGLFVLVAPTVEEFLFRGLLLHRWAMKWQLIPAILIVSVVFGVLHINPVGLTVFAVMMALLYLKSCKLAVPMLAHGLNNSVVAVSLWVPQPAEASPSLGSIQTGILLLCVALPLLGWLAYSLWTGRKVTLPYAVNGD